MRRLLYALAIFATSSLLLAPQAQDVTATGTILDDDDAGGDLNLGTLVNDGEPTPEQISLYLPVTGALDAAATNTCQYRVDPAGAWTACHPLYRIDTALSPDPDIGGALTDAFAFPIIGLSPGVTYDVEVEVCEGATCETVALNNHTTRALPAACGTATDTWSGSGGSSGLNSAIAGLTAGEVLEISGNHTVTGIVIDIAGTEGNEICIRGASRDTTLTDTAGSILELQDAHHLIIENLTLVGSQNASGSVFASRGIFQSDNGHDSTRVTVRNVTITGVENAILLDGEVYEFLAYNFTATGNNTWSQDLWTDGGPCTLASNSVLDIEESCTWNDDGVRAPGVANAIFQGTLTGFGDTISVNAHSGSDALAEVRSVYFYRLDVGMSGDDFAEADYVTRNVGIYDNRSDNSMTCLSLDPLFGGPVLFARNQLGNVGRTCSKWNTANGTAGMHYYNNTQFGSKTKIDVDDGSTTYGLWYNSGQSGSLVNRRFAFVNNLTDYRSGDGRILRWDFIGYEPWDMGYNGWGPGTQTFQFDFDNFTSVADCVATAPDMDPLYQSWVQPCTADQEFTGDQFDTAITLGSNFRTEFTTDVAVVLDATSTLKNDGLVIPNITGSDSTPDIGAFPSSVIPNWGDQSDIPAYLSSLDVVGETLEINSTVNGEITMQDVTPSEWLTSDPGNGFDFVIGAWSGGAGDPENGWLYVHGGGHNNSGNNGLYRFDVNGTSAPAGWELLEISAVADWVDCAESYADGFPTSIHSYGGLQALGGKFYRFLGAWSCSSGGAIEDAWKFSGGTWTQLTDFFEGGTGVTFADPVSGKILVSKGTGNNVRILDTSDDSWTGSLAMSQPMYEGDCGWDHTRSRAACTNGFQNTMVTVDFSAETITSTVTFSTTGDTEIFGTEAQASIEYHEGCDCYVILGGGGASTGWDSLYTMNADGANNSTRTVTATTLTGDDIDEVMDKGDSTNHLGSYNRMLLMDDWCVAFVVGDVNGSVYAVRLPGCGI
jgi:hypothetical protein